MLHVLLLPSFYSDPDKPVLGSFFKDQAQALRKAGLTVGVAYVEPRRLRAIRISRLRENHGQITSGEEDGLRTMRLHGWNPLLQYFPGGIVWSFATRLLVRRYIRTYGRPDLIHAHNAHWAGFAAYQISGELGIPYVITEHSSRLLMGVIPQLLAMIARRAYRRASEVLVVSKAAGNALEKLLCGKKLRVIPNCVNTDFFTPPNVTSSSRDFVFLTVAHLSPNKGIDILLRAFAARFRGDPGVSLRIGGDGPIKEDLIALCRRLSIAHKVQFLGALSRTEVRGEMWSANAFVLASFRETFGVVLIEALATGLPVIATRSGGPEDIVSDEVGILVKPGHVDELSQAMQQLRNNPRPTRRGLHDWTSNRYSEAVLASALQDIYAGVPQTAI